ncbi:MAG: hypothetical protein Kow006_19830 [Gammaproteobacteria bacterium]
MDPFLPSTPEQRDFSNPLLELREKRVAEWCDELPLHDATGSVRALLERLTPLNLEPLGDKARMRLLELYQRPVQIFHDDWSLLQRQLKDLQPAQQLEIKEQLGELLWQLASGYKIVVRHGAGEKTAATKEPHLHLALYRAIESLGMVLLHAYRHYAAIPPHAYRELNQLYEYAVQQGVAQTRAPLGRKEATDYTPEFLYKLSLLLAAADPFRLPKGGVDELRRLLVPFVDHCTLHRPPWIHAKGRFLVSSDEDRSPIPCSKLKRAAAAEAAWILDTNPLLAAAQHQINAGGTGERSEKALQLLRRILPDLKEPPKRKALRRSSEKRLRVSVGLDATHYFLSPAGAERLRQTDENPVHGIEVHDAETASQIAYLLEPWKVINESPRGYQLARRHALDEALQVGECLGLFPARSDDPRRGAEVGIVRWIKRLAEQWTHIGVEVLPGRPDAVLCEPADPTASPFDEPRALFINRVTDATLPPTLLGRRGIYRKECPVTLKRGTNRGEAKIGSLILETHHLERVTLKPVR